MTIFSKTDNIDSMLTSAHAFKRALNRHQVEDAIDALKQYSDGRRQTGDYSRDLDNSESSDYTIK